jgi:uncharacterized protein (DUF488 family)
MLFTIGHSTHQINVFLDRLKQHGINCVIDVRSYPFSKIAPQFNKPSLSGVLKANSILYLHLPEEFGARRTEKEYLNDDGKVNFEKVRESEAFKRGISRIKNGLSKGFKIALMCAEADPLICHRFSMISRGLTQSGLEVQHILKNGDIVSNNMLEEKLLEKFQTVLPRETLFTPLPSKEEIIREAYRLQNSEIAFTSIHTDDFSEND